jgi:hypothetical protein
MCVVDLVKLILIMICLYENHWISFVRTNILFLAQGVISFVEFAIAFCITNDLFLVEHVVCFLYNQQNFPLTTYNIDLEISIFSMT